MKIKKLPKENLWAVYWSDTGSLLFCFEKWVDALKAAIDASRLERR